MTFDDIVTLLGGEAKSLLSHSCQRLTKEQIHHTSARHVSEVFKHSDRSAKVQNNLKKLYGQGRLGGTGYLAIFPVDQGIEHTAGYSFAHNPAFFDPETIVRMAVESGANGVTSSLGVLGLVSSKYADKIPFIVKLNHNELLSYPNSHDQVMFAQVQQAFDMGARGVGATIYFGSPESRRQITEVAAAFAEAHRLGLFTILWCYPRNEHFQTENANLETSADISGQACYLGVSIEADIIKQKMPTVMDGFRQLGYSKYSDELYQTLMTNHPIDLVRYQVANCYMGKIGLLNSGGSSFGDDDVQQAVRSAVINKRAGGSGLIMGRKVFNRSFDKGLALLQAVQDVYLEPQITLA